MAQNAYFKASNAALEDEFGASVAISGDLMVVGARREDSDATGVDGDETNNAADTSGAAYVFVRTGSGWSQEAYLKASNTDAQDFFARVVAISGDTIAIASQFEDGGASGVNGDDTDNSAPSAGAVYVFRRSGTTWTQEAYLKPLVVDAGDQFGRSVTIEGDTIVVGALEEDGSSAGVNGDATNNDAPGAGAAYVFVRSGTQWSQQAYLKASNPDAGDRFGRSVALRDDVLVVGAFSEYGGAPDVDGDQSDNSVIQAGAAYVFRRTGSTWAQEAYLKATTPGPVDGFGTSVAVFGNTVVVGANGEDSSATGVDGDSTDDSAFAAGAAYVFQRAGGVWLPDAYLKASNTERIDAFGITLAVSDDVIAIGAVVEDSAATGINGDDSNNSANASGAVYLFSRSGATWVQEAYVKASNAGAGDLFALSMALDGDQLLVGAPGERSGAVGVGGDETDNSTADAGAAYLFDLDGLGARYCVSEVNSSGQAAVIYATGSLDIALSQVSVTATALPANTFGFFLVSADQGFVPGVNGLSNGNLCLSGSIARYVGPGQTMDSGPDGQFTLALDLTGIPQSSGGPVAVQPGDTWNFQGWFRDGVGLGSNLTDGIALTFD